MAVSFYELKLALFCWTISVLSILPKSLIMTTTLSGEYRDSPVQQASGALHDLSRPGLSTATEVAFSKWPLTVPSLSGPP